MRERVRETEMCVVCIALLLTEWRPQLSFVPFALICLTHTHAISNHKLYLLLSFSLSLSHTHCNAPYLSWCTRKVSASAAITPHISSHALRRLPGYYTYTSHTPTLLLSLQLPGKKVTTYVGFINHAARAALIGASTFMKGRRLTFVKRGSLTRACDIKRR